MRLWQDFLFLMLSKFNRILLTLMMIIIIGGGLSTAYYYITLYKLNQRGLNFGVILEPPVLDPTINASASIGDIVLDNVFEGLVKFNEDGTISPSLAKSWEITNDGLHYRFFLEENVYFHNGKRLTSQDVAYSLKRARDVANKNPNRQYLSSVDTVVIESEFVVKISLIAPNSNLLANLAMATMIVVDEDSVSSNAEKPNGTGPFQFSAWDKGKSITIKRNEHYWGKLPRLHTVTFKFINPDKALEALTSKEVDGFSNFPIVEKVDEVKKNSDYRVTVGTTEGEIIIALNHADPALAKLGVRQAIAMGINKNSLLFDYGGEFAQNNVVKIGSHFAPHQNNYIDLSNLYPYNPTKAQRNLEKEGYLVNDLSFTLKLPPVRYARIIGEPFSKMMENIGIKISVENLSWAEWLDQVYTKKDYQMSIIAHIEPRDMGIYARKDNYFNYHNPEFNRVFNQIELAVESVEQSRLIIESQKILADDEAVIFLYQFPKINVSPNNLKGMWKNNPASVNELRYVYWSP